MQNLLEHGIGEIFLNSVDRDGQKNGYDLDYLKEFSDQVKLPIIGCGGAGDFDDMYQLSLNTKCDGIAAANIFHHIEHSVYLAKEYLSKKQTNLDRLIFIMRYKLFFVFQNFI